MTYAMVKNNHQLEQLEGEFFNQDFGATQSDELLAHYQRVAQNYARVENSIAVLSDMSQNRSYVYYGAVADRFGLSVESGQELNSIWEEDIYNLIHPDDLTARNIQELHYFMLLKRCSKEQRCNYYTLSNIRMRDTKGDYISMLHRTIYFSSTEGGALWLALCLYNFAYVELEPRPFSGVIQNSATGEIYSYNDRVNILSNREIEVLRLIESGYRSKEIAEKLSLSINTINRHRQNIIERLCVGSSIEAIRKARELKIGL